MKRSLSVCTICCAAATIAAACASSRYKTSTDQVARGQELFARHCAECHGEAGEGGDGPRLVGLERGALPLDPPASRKVRKTRFRTAGDVADFVLAEMPAKKPESVTPEEKLTILAFALRANGVDFGNEPLTLAKARSMTIPR